MKKKSMKSLLLGSMIIFVLGFFAYQIIQSFFLPTRTETVFFTEEKETVEANGFIIRDEHPVAHQTEDVLFYVEEDGAHVAQSGVIARRYKSASDVAAQQEIARLDLEIDKLQKFENLSDRMAVNPETLQTKVDERVIALLAAVNEGAYDAVEKEREEVLYVFNERLILFGKAENFSKRIDALKEKKRELEAESEQSIGELRAEKSGYFISRLDGFEKTFSYEQAAALLPEDLNLEGKTPEPASSGVIGKIVRSYDWYVALTVPGEEVRRIQENQNIKLNIPSALREDIPVTLEAVNYNADRTQAAVIFRCDYMNKALSGIRESRMSIVLGTHRGLKIPKAAIRIRKCTAHVLAEPKQSEEQKKEYEEKEAEYEGVYVRIGGQMFWRHIERLYAKDGYVICAVLPTGFDPEKTRMLDYYDEVIVEGRNLDDGQFI